jgi:TolA-binding protein
VSELEPLDPALAEALRQASIPAPPEGTRERMLGRLSLVLPAATPGVNAPAAHPHAGSLVGAGAVSAKGAAVIAVAFFAGGAAGGAAVSALRTAEPPRVVYVDRVVSAAASGSATAPAPGASSPGTAAPPASRASVSSASAPVPAVPQGEHPSERLLIDDARAGLASGDAATALARLDEHARRYKHGQLDEEREALAVQALAQLGRYDDARARAARFRQRWPDSVYLSAVDATLKSIP